MRLAFSRLQFSKVLRKKGVQIQAATAIFRVDSPRARQPSLLLGPAETYTDGRLGVKSPSVR
jgi:hypothetical protein